jgi:hypothetical protein
VIDSGLDVRHPEFEASWWGKDSGGGLVSALFAVGGQLALAFPGQYIIIVTYSRCLSSNSSTSLSKWDNDVLGTLAMIAFVNPP